MNLSHSVHRKIQLSSGTVVELRVLSEEGRKAGMLAKISRRARRSKFKRCSTPAGQWLAADVTFRRENYAKNNVNGMSVDDFKIHILEIRVIIILIMFRCPSP